LPYLEKFIPGIAHQLYTFYRISCL